MKDKFIVLYIFLLIALIGIMLLSIMGKGTGLVAFLIVATFILTWIILSSWMKFVSTLLKRSNKILLKRNDEVSTWSFSNLEKLEQSQDEVKRKFEISAELISNLAHPEKFDSLDALTTEHDPIKTALRAIRTEMLRLKDEDEKQAWIAQGLAKFSNILREKGEVKEYGYRIVSNLVKYLGANQGGLFIEFQDDDGGRFLELAACYAYEKRKYLENRVYEGQGLLGQCMLEKDFIFITDVPKDYVKITSGLGFSTPRNIVVAPLIFNESFCGAIEIALFEVMSPFQIEFLKKVCENIASEIASLKNIEKTQALLKESQQLTLELQSREEEMKQNLEELAATQEEMARKQAELAGMIDAIDATLATVEFDTHGKVVKWNSNLQKIFGFTEKQLDNQTYHLLTANANVSWNDILLGRVRLGDYSSRKEDGTMVWLSVTFTIITDGTGRPIRVLSLIQDITQRKNKEREFERLSLVANNTDNSVIVTNKEGFTEYVNAGFTKMTGYEPHEIIGKKPGSLLQGPLTDKNTVDKLRDLIAEGVPIYEEILNYNRHGESYWVSLAINPVRDDQGEISQFISIQADITQTKIEALDFHQKMQALGRSNAIIDLDMNGVILDSNENYLTLLGYKKEELIGKPYSFLTRKEHVFKKVLATIEEHGLQAGTFARFDKQGNKHFLKLMDYPVLNLKGEVVKIIEFGLDVTNEKRLEKETERKQAELDGYLAGINNTIASAEFDFNGRFVNANDIFLKVMRYDIDELKNVSFDFFMGNDQSVTMMWENLCLGKFFSGEFKMRDKDGKELWLTGTFNPILIENNAPEKIMMFAQFTTQEKEKVTELNGMVQALKSTLPVVEFTEQMLCKTANEKALKMFGFSRMQLKNKTILDFIAPYYHQAWLKKQPEILNSDFTNLVIPVLVGDQTVTFDVSFSLTRNLEGGVSKVIVILIKEATERVSMLAAV